MNLKEQILFHIKRIPSGKTASYGQVGNECDPPVGGRTVGRLIATCPPDIPWWRVVNNVGNLSIYKRNPAYAQAQKELLEKEKVEFISEYQINIDKHRYLFDTYPTVDNKG